MLKRYLVVVVAALTLFVGVVAALKNRPGDDVAGGPTPTISVLGGAVTPSPRIPVRIGNGVTLTPAPTVRVPALTPAPTPRQTTTTTTSSTTTTTSTTTTNAKPASRPARPTVINCGDASQAQFCAPKVTMVVKDGKVESLTPASASSTGDKPNFAIVSTPMRAEGDRAVAVKPGEKVEFVAVEVTVNNDTSRPYWVWESEVIGRAAKDGQALMTQDGKADDFSLEPGASLTGSFPVPVDGDGTYTWYGEAFWWAG